MKNNENANEPVLVTVTNKQMDVDYYFTSKCGEFKKKIPVNLKDNENTDIDVKFLNKES